jgi:hypothetical protein
MTPRDARERRIRRPLDAVYVSMAEVDAHPDMVYNRQR